jgi:DNA-directed RNA polymerase specialized sigma24 family protein
MGEREIDRPQIDLEIHDRLVAWAKWARGRHLPNCLHVICRSIESGFLAPAGDVWMTAEEALKASIKASEPISRGDEWETERIVSSLPGRHRDVLRLHYVVFKRMPMVQKRKLLGVTEDDYWVLLTRAGQMLRNRLDKHTGMARIPVIATIRPPGHRSL